MSTDLSRFHQLFFEEASEHLSEMERLLLALDLAAPVAQDLDAIFRAAHSIKGSSGTFGFNDMTDVTHVLETLLDRVRKGEHVLTDEMVDALLRAGDVLRVQLDGHRDGIEIDPQDAEHALQQLRILTETQPPLREKTPALLTTPQPECSEFLIHYTPGANPAAPLEVVLAELCRLGEITVEQQDVEQCILRLSGTTAIQDIEDIFSFIASADQYSIESAQAALPSQEISADEDDLGFGFFEPLEPAAGAEEKTDDDGFGFFVDPASLPAAQNAVEEDLGYGFFTDIPPAPTVATRTAPIEELQSDTPRRRASDREADSSIRVSVDKVDQLINLVGELVITHAMLAQTISALDPVQHEKLFNGMSQLERNSRDLQESVMSIRMMPIGSVFNRFPRLVRDLSAKIGKQIELKLVGESTELDKGLIERLADPLTHLVRNSLDHGIEAPEIRIDAGKSAKGLLTLQAAHQGGNVVIEVIDDGAGLDRERILAKARQRSIPVSDNAPDQEIWQLIFAPGFSTAETVTDISGRGVGMDVVKRNIEGMGGRVEISSQQGLGTRITIRLPLTLAILDGMSIGVGDQTFILPLNMIVESLQPTQEQISTISGTGRVVHVRSEYLPLLALHEVLNIAPHTQDPCKGIVVILEVQDAKVGLYVDALLGQHQVVIKSLENNYRKVRGISGATIMGDGRVALILDAAALVQLSRN